MAYTGTVDLISGIRPKNNQTFPLVNAKDVYVDDETRLDDVLGSVVKIDGQSLTEEQKTAARTNIGAASEEEVSNLVDSTLTLTGKAADAKVTGDKLTKLKDDLNTELYGGSEKNYEEDKNFDATGNVVPAPGKCISEYIPYTWTNNAAYDCGDNTDKFYYVVFYDSEKNQLNENAMRFPATTGNVTYRIINAETAITTGTPAYVRFSFKKGEVGKIYPNSTTIYWAAQSVAKGGVIPSIGNLDILTTTNKDSLVSAINEVKNSVPDISLPIYPEDTTFFEVGRNLVDPTSIAPNEFVNQTSGAFSPNTRQSRTAFVSVTGGKKYCIANSTNTNVEIRYFFYTDDYTPIQNSGYLGYLDDIGSLVEAPASASFIVVSLASNQLPLMIARSDTKINYEEYGGTIIKPEYIDIDITDTVNDLIDARNFISKDNLLIKPRDTTFFHSSNNLVDPTTLVYGYVNQVTGAFTDGGTTNRRTPRIAIKPATSYCIRFGNENDTLIRYFFYDSAEAPIPGSGANVQLSDSNFVLTSPSNAAYIAFSASSNRGALMMAESDTKIDIEDYNNVYILPEYIPSGLENVVLNLPDKIYATTGIELNIFFENITENWKDYVWGVACSKGMQLERGYRITPVDSDAGSYPLTITIYPKGNYSVSKSVSTTLVISASTAGSGQSKSVIILGDSTTNNGKVIEKLNENFSTDAMSVTTLGTRGTAPNNHEGRSGWTFELYFTKDYIDYTDGRGHVENPFYNPSISTFDAAYYFSHTSVAKPDWFIINMGINDVFSPKTDSAVETAISTTLNYLDAAIQSVASASPSSKIGVCVTIPPNSSQEPFGKNGGCGQTRDRYKRNNVLWVHALIEHLSGNENVYIIPIHTNLDTVYNMGFEDKPVPVNARSSITYTPGVANGTVHPADDGYWQIADVYTAFLKAEL